MIRRDDLRFGLIILHTENTSTGWLSSVKILNRCVKEAFLSPTASGESHGIKNQKNNDAQ